LLSNYTLANPTLAPFLAHQNVDKLLFFSLFRNLFSADDVTLFAGISIDLFPFMNGSHANAD
jgi:hypothetical protein